MDWGTTFNPSGVFRQRFIVCLSILVVILLLLTGCALPVVRSSGVGFPPPDNRCWKRLLGLRSFEFFLRYQTGSPFALTARFFGSWQSPDRELWKGYWEREGERSWVHLRAGGETQFEQHGDNWRVGPRGIETSILQQMEQVLLMANLEFVGEEGGREIYRFKPNLPLIDWTGTMGLIGRLEIDKRNGLPVRIYCADSNRSGEWELRLLKFNRAKKVFLPFVAARRVRAVVTGGAWGCREKRMVTAIIRDRLAELGIDHRLKTHTNCLSLEINREMGMPLLRLLFGPGQVEIWSGIWAENSHPSGVAVAGDMAKKVVLEEVLASNGEFRATVDITLPVEPKLKIFLPGDQKEKEDKLLILVLDGVALGIGEKVEEGEYVFTGIGGEERVKVIAALANHSPLPVQLELSSEKD